MDVLLSVYSIDRKAIFPNIIKQDSPGLLLHAIEPVSLLNGDFTFVRTGLRINLPTGFWGEIRSVQRMQYDGLQVQCDVVPTVCFYIHPVTQLFISCFFP